jgi:hypothetical protein
VEKRREEAFSHMRQREIIWDIKSELSSFSDEWSESDELSNSKSLTIASNNPLGTTEEKEGTDCFREVGENAFKEGGAKGKQALQEVC